MNAPGFELVLVKSTKTPPSFPVSWLLLGILDSLASRKLGESSGGHCGEFLQMVLTGLSYVISRTRLSCLELIMYFHKLKVDGKEAKVVL